MLLVVVYQYEIVHITHIVLYTESLFYVVVEVVKHGKSDELRHLGAEPYTDFSERVHNFASPLRYLRVFNPLLDCRKASVEIVGLLCVLRRFPVVSAQK